MPKPINKTIGHCECSICNTSAAVRKMRGNGRLYLVCPECGTIRPEGQRFQEYILENAVMQGPDIPDHMPEIVPESVPGIPEPEPEPESMPKPVSAQPMPEPKPGFWRESAEEFNNFMEA